MKSTPTNKEKTMSFWRSKTTKYLSIIVLLASILVVFVFYILTQINSNNNLVNRLENALNTTRNLFEEQKRYALSLSLLLSEDKEIIDSFKAQNREESFSIVNRKIHTLKMLQNSSFEVQIHNKDLSTYLRNWDISIKDIPLKDFRQGLVKVYEDKKPLVSIELGKRLNIKAISPIMDKQTMIGSLETIIDFEYLAQQLTQKGYTLFVLLDKQFLNIATELENNPHYQEYIVVNKGATAPLKNLELNNLKDYGYISGQEYSFSYFAYYDLSHQKLGYVLTGIKNENHLQINNGFNNTAPYISKSKVIIE